MGSGSRRSDAAQTMVLAEFFADLFPAADFQFIKNIGDMFFDCRFGNIQFRGNFAVAFALFNEKRQLRLPVGETQSAVGFVSFRCRCIVPFCGRNCREGRFRLCAGDSLLFRCFAGFDGKNNPQTDAVQKGGSLRRFLLINVPVSALLTGEGKEG